MTTVQAHSEDQGFAGTGKIIHQSLHFFFYLGDRIIGDVILVIDIMIKALVTIKHKSNNKNRGVSCVRHEQVATLIFSAFSFLSHISTYMNTYIYKQNISKIQILHTIVHRIGSVKDRFSHHRNLLQN